MKAAVIATLFTTVAAFSPALEGKLYTRCAVVGTAGFSAVVLMLDVSSNLQDNAQALR